MTLRKRPIKVLHLIPHDAIGGVEMAAHSLPDGVYDEILFNKYFMVPKANAYDSIKSLKAAHQSSLNNPLLFISTVKYILKEKPDLLIASLWRAVLVMIICKILRPSMKTVTFLHNTHTSHGVDYITNAVGIRLASQIWTDSTATQKFRLNSVQQAKSRVVSFMLEKRIAQTRGEVVPSFIFWGRLRKQKNIKRAIVLFESIHSVHPTATFRILGPDGGERELIANEIRERNLGGAITLEGPKSTDEIAQAASEACFYLQTSDHEGMAMSVVEAMQFGLIPVVTPVGEISTYARDDFNAVFILDEKMVLEKINILLSKPNLAKAISLEAGRAWNARPTYRDDILRLSRELLEN